MRPRSRLLRVLAPLTLALAACADLGAYVWVDQYADPLAASDGGYVIGDGDLLVVHVFNQDNLTTRAKVRSDGRISLPLLHDVMASGYTPSALGQQLETRLKDFIRLPTVTVSVEESHPLSVLVAGEVAKQGQVLLEAGAGVLPALLAAGGLSDFAHKDRIFVVRRSASTPTVRIRFRLQDLLRAQDQAGLFKLRSGDTVVVE